MEKLMLLLAFFLNPDKRPVLFTAARGYPKHNLLISLSSLQKAASGTTTGNRSGSTGGQGLATWRPHFYQHVLKKFSTGTESIFARFSKFNFFFTRFLFWFRAIFSDCRLLRAFPRHPRFGALRSIQKQHLDNIALKIMAKNCHANVTRATPKASQDQNGRFSLFSAFFRHIHPNPQPAWR
ncbi:hypothetical protein [Fundidesulfovibrio agrisoli]|uniref:hypothetical protein n=1 Tax=Fundidesulfovibrio agrisoli TaxID=2922717 RepID=UPI001FAD7091|nr:hypothetical protein [Fundidesulfovibrio agrisoli]